MSESESLTLTAYYFDEPPGMAIVPAARPSDLPPDEHRTGPLLAGEAGWLLLNERRFTAEWSGGDRPDALVIRYEGERPAGRAISDAGQGTLTFVITYVFRTPPGFDLLVRGPANRPRDGIAPFETRVATDRPTSPFAMNWRFTRPGTVTFEAGDPFCMIVPQRRDELERFRAVVRPADEETMTGWRASLRRRHASAVRRFLATTNGAAPEGAGAEPKLSEFEHGS
jgi:hypothetical protein